MKNIQCEPEHFNGRIIFMSMYNDFEGEKTETQKNVFRILLKFRSMLAGFLAVVGHSWDLDQKRNGTRTVLINHTEIGTPIFGASSAFERGELDSKEHCKKSTQLNDNERNIEMLLRTVISNKISSVSMEPWQICAKHWTKINPKIQLQISPKIQKVQEHFMQMKY